jgi:DNA-3-methyladenine glycosylase I
MTERTAADLIPGPDGLLRCWWARDGLLAAYHDLEWGRGPTDEHALFERLCLEAFQAGLSWRIVLERRAALRHAYAGFDAARLARFAAADLERALAAPGTIRNRAKGTAMVENARILVALHAEGSGLRDITVAALRDAPPRSAAPSTRAEVPASTPSSVVLAQRLRAIGWRFVGPVTAYAYLQAVGWVDDHLAGCHARRQQGRADVLG